MARANTHTILPLDTFNKIIGLSPLYFNQIELQQDDPTGRAAMQPATICDFPLTQYEWQQGAAGCVGREEIARAIADAEGMLTNFCKFKPGVDWIRDETVGYPRPANPRLFSWGGDIRGYAAGIQTNLGYIQSGGVEAKSVITLSAPIVYTDLNADGYKETATVTITGLPAIITREDEIAMYYPGHLGDDAWEIRPIQARIDSLTATAVLTVRREQLVIETILEAFVAQAADGEDDADFLTTVDIYRHYNDPSIQVRLLFSGEIGCASCQGISGFCSACMQTSQPGCLSIRNSRLGLIGISPGEWDAVNGVFNSAYFAECRAPDRVMLSYRAGWVDLTQRNPMIELDPLWARAITYLALSILDRPICSCENIRAYTAYWAEDLSVTSSTPSGGTSSQRISAGLLDNPFGTTRGAIFAWRLVQRERLGEVVLF